MRICLLLSFFLFVIFFAQAQKKPLDPGVYDGWQSIGERLLSPDGKYLVYTVLPQEGDGRLVIRSVGGNYAKEIPRGANASISADGRWVVFRIKPFFKDMREARIRKKTPEQMPKDSLGWLELGTDKLQVIPRVKSYAVPEKKGGWMAYLLERPAAAKDSIKKIDSTEGTDLVLVDLVKGGERHFPLVSEYLFSPQGNTLAIAMTKRSGDSASRGRVLWYNTGNGKTDTILRGFNEVRNFALDAAGIQLAFVAERDSAVKALTKFYKLYYYTPGMDSAAVRADRQTIQDAVPAERLGYTVSPDYSNKFSKDGQRLYWGIAPVRPPKDTTLVDFETARLDIWNYQDDYLQPQQLVQLKDELKRAYTAMLRKGDAHIYSLGNANCETVVLPRDGEGSYALGESTRGYRVQEQWEGRGQRRLYLIDLNNGMRKTIVDSVRGGGFLSPADKYILWYDWKERGWRTYATATGKIADISRGISVPLYDEEDDHPDDPPPHGYMGWLKDDAKVYIYDKYDIWECDPSGAAAPVNLTRGIGRRHELSIRYVQLDKAGDGVRNEPMVKPGETVVLSLFDERGMQAGHMTYKMGAPFAPDTSKPLTFPQSYNVFFKAKERRVYGFLRGSYDKPYDVYVEDSTAAPARQYSRINPQQSDYNWLTVELHRWKMFDGKTSEGLLYKPENFDSTKKYPIIFYFYERDARTQYEYIAPQPVRASINVAYFVSNGYLVFDPDIFYKTGQPGEDAYNSVISAAKYLSQFKWVDTTKMGLQGHSWGGYQVAYLVTRTSLFTAAEAGAPVANMTSAYDGIRWESGVSREFQYEHGQSRIGANLWDHPELFIKNSPLFNADKVTTPLLMMANDADGAVPWYQGIEYFSALRRLGKKVWMMEYNGEAHGLLERRNRKDWSIRLSQFFGYYLKGEKPPHWMMEGVPATLKGLDWGLGTD